MTILIQGAVRIDSETDILTARRAVRDLAQGLGFSATDTTRIVTAASELARNVYKYAGRGTMSWQILNGSSQGIELRFEDRGPGISDVERALCQGYSTGRGLGMGLPGAKRLMDEIDICTEIGKGTTVIVKKWLRL